MSKLVRSIAYNCVDHDHHTGLMRGLLCSNCNAALGLLGDSVERIEAALGYLRRHTEGART